MDDSPVHLKADLSEAERELTREVRDLERRVSNLEQRVGKAVSVPDATPTPDSGVLPALPMFAEAVPIFGIALLGIAGAYLLRAMTELGVFPRPVGVAAGIVYAVVWLWLAARVPAGRGFAPVVNGLTSAVILAPLLWEATIRFHTMPSRTTAAVVAAFSLAGQALSWRKRLTILSGIASASAALIAAVLLVATQDPLSFTLALLAIAGGVELSVRSDRAPGPRWLVAVTADLSVLLFSILISRKEGLPEGYAPASAESALAAQALLLLVYGASAVDRTIIRRLRFTGFEATQTALVFFIGLGGAFQIAGANRPATSAVAGFALLCGSACYAISLVFFRRERTFNSHVYAIIAFLLVLAGSFRLASGLTLVAVWSAWAVVCCWTGLRARQPLLGLHGAILLLIASLVSGAAFQPAARLFGAGGASVPSLASGIVVAGAFFSYLAAARISTGRIAAVLISANLAWVVAGVATSGFAMIWQRLPGDRGASVPVATLGTAALMLLVAAAAWSGMKWQRQELIWLVYALMAVAGGKLLMRDLRLENTLPLVVSLLLYGGTLTVLPRMLRKEKALQA